MALEAVQQGQRSLRIQEVASGEIHYDCALPEKLQTLQFPPQRRHGSDAELAEAAQDGAGLPRQAHQVECGHIL
jgi:hypothetical protein